MDSSDKTLFARIAIGLVAVAAVLFACVLFSKNMDEGATLPKGSFDLSGEWAFHNGALLNESTEYNQHVMVPEPLAPQINGSLAAEYWYKKEFSLSDTKQNVNEPLAILLGTIKGEHEVFWNGERIGSGSKLVLAIYQVPASQAKKDRVKLEVRVMRTDHLFPGIVHKLPVALGPVSAFDKIREYYMFDSGTKPLLLGAFKFSLFFLFAFLFLTVPKKREYLSFSLFVLFSAFSAAVNSRYVPVYFDFFLRNALNFLVTTFAFCTIPWLTADTLRVPEKIRSYSRIYGAALASISFVATIWISNRALEVSLYQLAGRWLPLAVGIPSVVGCLWVLNSLPRELHHRRKQIGIFGSLLTVGTIAWWLNSGTLLTFSFVPYPELWDMGLFAGLALSAVMDMKFTSRRAERADKVVPKWFSGFLASGVDQVTLELNMVAIAVDTVGYTRILSELDDVGKAELHNKIRARMAPVIERFGAQKLSDRGDGALFAWELTGTEENKRSQIRAAVAGAEFLVTESANSVGIKFRVGMAAGIVRGELKGSELSFLGEPLNAASRLEAAAVPGTVLLHESAAKYLDSATLSNEWINIEVKGVSYRAQTLSKAG